jgi:hypothetical protein
MSRMLVEEPAYISCASLNLSITFLSIWGLLQHFSRHFSKQLLRYKFYNGCSSLLCEMTVPSRTGNTFTLSIPMTLQTTTTTSILHISELLFGPVFSLILKVRNFGWNICQLGKVSFSAGLWQITMDMIYIILQNIILNKNFLNLKFIQNYIILWLIFIR